MASVRAGEYSSPEGYSFTYPDGWTAASKHDVDMNSASLPKEFKNWVAKTNVDLNQLSVVLVHIGHEQFAENLNVVVVPQELPMNENSVTELTGVLEQQYRTMGIAPKQLQGRLQEVGKNKAIVFTYEAQLPGIGFPVMQKQVYFSGGGKSYIVTCSASTRTFANTLPTFDAILASFNVPTPSTLSPEMKNIIIMAVVGGIIGGLIGLFKKFRGN